MWTRISGLLREERLERLRWLLEWRRKARRTREDNDGEDSPDAVETSDTVRRPNSGAGRNKRSNDH